MTKTKSIRTLLKIVKQKIEEAHFELEMAEADLEELHSIRERLEELKKKKIKNITKSNFEENINNNFSDDLYE
ncbi:MAG TPA: hypothetical protein P5136_00655 [Methanofastidiosum sp.]|nr:hypothetical protein [Methanofastidiosum sp.]